MAGNLLEVKKWCRTVCKADSLSCCLTLPMKIVIVLQAGVNCGSHCKCENCLNQPGDGPPEPRMPSSQRRAESGRSAPLPLCSFSSGLPPEINSLQTPVLKAMKGNASWHEHGISQCCITQQTTDSEEPRILAIVALKDRLWRTGCQLHEGTYRHSSLAMVPDMHSG